MQFQFTSEEQAFRDDVMHFFENDYPRDIVHKSESGADLGKPEFRASQQAIFRKGWAGGAWPQRHGGLGWSRMQRYIFETEMAAAGAGQARTMNYVQEMMIAPLIYTFGDAQQRERFLPSIQRGDMLWCQGFSESGAGSDLASLSTLAIREGAHYVVNGAKLWITLAHEVDWICCLTRNDRKSCNQAGLTILLIDLASKGVSVKPIITLDGRHEINEVHFDNVHVPDTNRLGIEGRGWAYASYMLRCERGCIADVESTRRSLTTLRRTATVTTINGNDLMADVTFAHKLVELEVEWTALHFTELRSVRTEETGSSAEVFSSILKLKGSEVRQRLSEVRMDAAGYFAHPDDPRLQSSRTAMLAHDWPFLGLAMPQYLEQRKASIYGGTTEIHKNNIAMALLGKWPQLTDFTLNDTQVMFRDSVERYLRNARGAGSEYHWKKFAEFGWLGLPFSVDDGGMDGTAVETMILMEACGRALIRTPWLGTIALVGGFLRKAATRQQRDQWIPELVGGRCLAAFAFVEPQAGYCLCDVTTKARRDASGFELTGSKSVVTDGPDARLLIVPARTEGAQRNEDGLSLFLVETKTPGVEMKNYRTVDGGNASEISFHHVRLQHDALLGAQDQAFPLIRHVTAEAMAVLAAEAVGAMDALIRATAAYATSRVQFGHPLIDFQVIEHRIVEMLIEYEQARSLLFGTSAMIAHGHEDFPLFASALKVKIARAGRFVGQSAIQLHGAIGMTAELDVGHYFKRLATFENFLGSADWHLGMLAASAAWPPWGKI